MLLHLIYVEHGYGLDYFDLLEGSMAGVMMGLAYVLIAEGIANGIAGPVQALMSTHALH